MEPPGNGKEDIIHLACGCTLFPDPDTNEQKTSFCKDHKPDHINPDSAAEQFKRLVVEWFDGHDKLNQVVFKRMYRQCYGVDRQVVKLGNKND